MCHSRLTLFASLLGSLVALAACGGTVQESNETPDPPDAAPNDASKPEASTPDAPLNPCNSPSPAGCFYNGIGCPMGQVCEHVGCAPSSCVCSPEHGWGCTADCAGGTCVYPQDAQPPDGGCYGPNPAGCFYNGIGCGPNEYCSSEGCAPSSCWCENGYWTCTKDCGGGTCRELKEGGPDVYDAPCPGPNPAGCFYNGIGCPAGQHCANVGCTPSSCSCYGGGWACTDDCGGGSCVYSADAQPPDAYFDAGQDCQAIAQSISSQIKDFNCTAVVRLDYSSFQMIGWQFVCGGFKQVDQNTARAIAQADTGYGDGQALSPAKPSDEHVFFSSPGDFGGVGVVSATSGLSVFGGSIVWSGAGDITWPKTPWNAPLAPAPNCTINLWPKWTGYDLESGIVSKAFPFETALQTVFASPLPMGISNMLYIQDAVVLRYPRTVGAFDPSNAEWIVLLNAIWLE